MIIQIYLITYLKELFQDIGTGKQFLKLSANFFKEYCNFMR